MPGLESVTRQLCAGAWGYNEMFLLCKKKNFKIYLKFALKLISINKTINVVFGLLIYRSNAEINKLALALHDSPGTVAKVENSSK